MAVKQEFTFLSGDGKTDVHAVRWLPDNGDYRAVFQISHGMIEFIERNGMNPSRHSWQIRAIW